MSNVTPESSVDGLRLTVRTTNLLKAESIYTVGRLIELSVSDVLRLHQFGRKSMKEVRYALAANGLRLRGDMDAPICTPASVEPEQKTKGCSDMTLRDYFAAKAMQALIAEPSWGEGCTPTYCRMSEEKNDESKMITQSAYKLADAMLEARKK